MLPITVDMGDKVSRLSWMGEMDLLTADAIVTAAAARIDKGGGRGGDEGLVFFDRLSALAPSRLPSFLLGGPMTGEIPPFLS